MSIVFDYSADIRFTKISECQSHIVGSDIVERNYQQFDEAMDNERNEKNTKCSLAIEMLEDKPTGKLTKFRCIMWFYGN